MSPSEREEFYARLAPLVEALQHGLDADLTALALFGSRARGEARPESDWDILLIANHLPEKPLQRHFYIKAMLPDHWRARVSILAKTPAEFESRLPALYLDIALDGILLHDPQGYLHQRLTRLRNLMQRLRLQRERVNGDWAWRWQQTPPADRSLAWEAAP
jgi:predicted nucleotidyltransferase